MHLLYLVCFYPVYSDGEIKYALESLVFYGASIFFLTASPHLQLTWRWLRRSRCRLVHTSASYPLQT